MGEERERALRVVARHFLAAARASLPKISGTKDIPVERVSLQRLFSDPGDGAFPGPRRRRPALAPLAGMTLLAGAGMTVAGLLLWSPAARPPAVGIAGGSPAAGTATWPFGAAARSPARAPVALAPAAPPMPFAVPARVTVPAIGVSASVISLGENRDGSAAVPSLMTPQLTSWFDEGPAPGQSGAAAIFGHVNTAAGPAVFSRLGDLVPGDTVEVTRADGTVARFQVYRVAEYVKDAFPTAAVYGYTPAPELRLITCGGAFDAATRSYRDNIVAYARLVR